MSNFGFFETFFSFLRQKKDIEKNQCLETLYLSMFWEFLSNLCFRLLIENFLLGIAELLSPHE